MSTNLITKNIVFGFNSPDYIHNVKTELKLNNVDVNAKICLSKKEISEFVNSHPEYTDVVLLEVISSDGILEKYTPQELSFLTDNHDVNVIIVISAAHKGTDYVRDLYEYGITSAVFQDGRTGGASEKLISELILNKRSRRDARKYYEIDYRPSSISSLTNKEFAASIEYLKNPDNGRNVAERFVTLTSTMSPLQISTTIEKLNEEIINELSVYEEFYIIIDSLKKYGIELKYKRPKKLKIGMYAPSKAQMIPLSAGNDKEVIESTGKEINQTVHKKTLSPEEEAKFDQVEAALNFDEEDTLDTDEKIVSSNKQEPLHEVKDEEEEQEIWEDDELSSLLELSVDLDEGENASNDLSEHEEKKTNLPDWNQNSFSDEENENEAVMKNNGSNNTTVNPGNLWTQLLQNGDETDLIFADESDSNEPEADSSSLFDSSENDYSNDSTVTADNFNTELAGGNNSMDKETSSIPDSVPINEWTIPGMEQTSATMPQELSDAREKAENVRLQTQSDTRNSSMGSVVYPTTGNSWNPSMNQTMNSNMSEQVSSGVYPSAYHDYQYQSAVKQNDNYGNARNGQQNVSNTGSVNSVMDMMQWALKNNQSYNQTVSNDSVSQRNSNYAGWTNTSESVNEQNMLKVNQSAFEQSQYSTNYYGNIINPYGNQMNGYPGQNQNQTVKEEPVINSNSMNEWVLRQNSSNPYKNQNPENGNFRR